jgi:hypothetical protein
MPAPEVDIFEVAAKKMSNTALKKTLRLYHQSNPQLCKLINGMKKVDTSEAPDTLMHLIVTYWRKNFNEPPLIAMVEPERDSIADKVMIMTVDSLREVLIEAYAGDVERCAKIRTAAKGNMRTPDSLVHMYYPLLQKKTI